MGRPLMSARTIASARRQAERLLDGFCDIIEDVKAQTDLGETETQRVREADVPFRLEPYQPAGADPGTMPQEAKRYRGLLPADTDIRSTDSVRVRDSQGNDLGIWAIKTINDPRSGEEFLLEVEVVMTILYPTAPTAGNDRGEEFNDL